MLSLAAVLDLAALYFAGFGLVKLELVTVFPAREWSDVSGVDMGC